ncbi:hypothetical protein BN2497_12693 [Janthinobacterium sp. CG23_2]|nr:hypothetical protein BN2497_12693 [Janthinobacterium sp. CG23_2]CUU32744.1 hypothetical protein BN3177_12693 [Janthinobacterium sp. CG23_2]
MNRIRYFTVALHSVGHMGGPAARKTALDGGLAPSDSGVLSGK